MSVPIVLCQFRIREVSFRTFNGRGMQMSTQQAYARSPALLAAFIHLCAGHVLDSISLCSLQVRAPLPRPSPLVVRLMVSTRPSWSADRAVIDVVAFQAAQRAGYMLFGCGHP